MELKQITEQICPVCGASAVAETKDKQHTNGHWNESRSFACGLKLEFSPNFMRTEKSKYYLCKNDPVTIAERARNEVALRKLTQYISRLNVSPDFRSDLTDAVRYNASMRR